MPKGQPTLYKVDYPGVAYKLCLLGATDKDLAGFFEVTDTTINNWKLEHADFFESIKKGKIEADANVAEKLYHRAMGYEHEEDVIFNDKGSPLIVPTVKHYPPETAAAIFWLKNRQKSMWRDKIDTENINIVTDFTEMSEEERAERIAELLNKR